MLRIAIGCFCLMLAGTIFTHNSYADEFEVPIGQQGDQTEHRPASGMSTDTVEATFGAPQSVKGPIGDPPITTWEYERFSVYFEYDRVIHSVLHST